MFSFASGFDHVYSRICLFLVWTGPIASPSSAATAPQDLTNYQLLQPQPPRTLLQSPPREMQTWRRAFATSARRLGHNPPTATSNGRPAFLRCAQILQESKKHDNCSYADQEVRMHGFIRSVRKQKRIAFAEISDGSTIEPVQAILQPAQAVEYVFFLLPIRKDQSPWFLGLIF